MDTRYKDRGYTAKFTETEYAAGMEIYNGDTLLVGVTFAFVDGGARAKPKVVVQVRQAEAIGRTIVDNDDDDDLRVAPRKASVKRPVKRAVKKRALKKKR